jgi:1-phosphofructokinase family hexose kinase
LTASSDGVEDDRPMLVAGPNLTIDRTSTIDELRPGDVLRFADVVVTPGGKGVNVARVAQALSAPALLVGFTPGRTGAAAAGLLGDEGLDVRAVPVGGEIRATIVVLERGGRVTVINEPGPPLDAGDWERYEAAVAAALPAHRVLACSGSVPPGAPADAYARLVAAAAERDVPAIVDSGGPLLAAALAAEPAVVAPNLAEAEGLLRGRADETVEAGPPEEVRRRAEAAAGALVERGARQAVVTAGAAGAAVAGAAGVGWHPAPAVTVRNPIGAGDALVGGLGVALERGEPFERAVVLGLATAAASVESARAGGVDPGRARALAALPDTEPGSAVRGRTASPGTGGAAGTPGP